MVLSIAGLTVVPMYTFHDANQERLEMLQNDVTEIKSVIDEMNTEATQSSESVDLSEDDATEPVEEVELLPGIEIDPTPVVDFTE